MTTTWGRYFFWDDNSRQLRSISEKVPNFEELVMTWFSTYISGITTDRKVYRPEDDIYFLIGCPTNPEEVVTLQLLKNGKQWFKEHITLDQNGLGLYMLDGADIGMFEARLLQESGTENQVLDACQFEVAIFELDPLTVKVVEQTIEEGRLLHATLQVTLLKKPYTGNLSLHHRCSTCNGNMTLKAVTSQDGKAVVTIPFLGHESPFWLEVSIPDLGHVTAVLFEHLEKEEVTPIPISDGLQQNHGLLLFPQARTRDVMGINILPLDQEVQATAPFSVDSIMGDEIRLTVNRNFLALSLVLLTPHEKEVRRLSWTEVSTGTSYSFNPYSPYTIVLVGGIDDQHELHEAFFVAFPKPMDHPRIHVPEAVNPGDTISLTIENPSDQVVGCFLLIHDLKVAHSSLYKALGKTIHASITGNLRLLSLYSSYLGPEEFDLPITFLTLDSLLKLRKQALRSLAPWYLSYIARHKRLTELKKIIQEPMEELNHRLRMIIETIGRPSCFFVAPRQELSPSNPLQHVVSPLSMINKSLEETQKLLDISPSAAESTGSSVQLAIHASRTIHPGDDSLEDETAFLEDDMLASSQYDYWEQFPLVLTCQKLTLAPHETKTISLDLGDQLTTWVVRLTSFTGLQFKEDIRHVNVNSERYLTMRAPAILDTTNNDVADVEIHCLSDKPGRLNVFCNEIPLVRDAPIRPGRNVIHCTVNQNGSLLARLQVGEHVLETKKEIFEPFMQVLTFNHVVHLFPGDHFVPPLPVQVLPTVSPILKDMALALLKYPQGCAEQTAAKIGGLALAYRYFIITNGHGREASSALNLMKVGLARLRDHFYDEETGLFRLWNDPSSKVSITTTIWVLNRLIPVNALKTNGTINFPHEYSAMISNAVQALLKRQVTSMDLLPYSSEFLPTRDLSDVHEIAHALTYLQDATPEEKRTWLSIIKNAAEHDGSLTWWKSKKVHGKLEPTARVLQALVSNYDILDEELKKYHARGFNMLNQWLLDKRLFSTNDTFAFLSLLAAIPQQEPVIVRDGGKEIHRVTKPIIMDEPFTAQAHLIVTWDEERLVNPFARLPASTLEASVSLDKTKLRVGERSRLKIHVPNEEDASYSVLAICLPPHLALIRGGAPVQQHYIAFEGKNTLELELIAIRTGKGHVNLVVHNMYDAERARRFDPIFTRATS